MKWKNISLDVTPAALKLYGGFNHSSARPGSHNCPPCSSFRKWANKKNIQEVVNSLRDTTLQHSSSYVLKMIPENTDI
ncbi:unnamed protein product [Ceratitis capitata]|uniref:(Mediterranean fruit fly) hypothetical protein n=1 Tax=Ceratitis capitata TaxID=7213 RepID=A0A811UQI9_CERCA|nr:unnamed protein product [Ceratitis capitata]